MHVLALVNQKGGCGKTTVAVNLAAALARAGQRVLLADLDPQAHATMAMGCGIEDELTLADLFLGHASVPEVVHAAPMGVGLLPGSLELREFEEVAERTLHPEHVLDNALAKVADSYDFALLDCPPRTDGVLAANALRAADTAVLVVETGAFALQGALRAVGVLEEIAESMECEFDLRVVGTLFDRRTRLMRELLIGIHARFGSLLYDTVIRQSVRLREAAACGVPVQELDPKCRASLEFEALAQEILAELPQRAFGLERRSPFLTTRTSYPPGVLPPPVPTSPR